MSHQELESLVWVLGCVMLAPSPSWLLQQRYVSHPARNDGRDHNIQQEAQYFGGDSCKLSLNLLSTLFYDRVERSILASRKRNHAGSWFVCRDCWFFVVSVLSCSLLLTRGV